MENTKQNASGIDVARVCELANIDLTPEESSVFQEQMSTIVSYVRKIAELDVSGIEPTVHGQPVSNVFREDVPAASLPIDKVLANAPETSGREIRMPRIVE